MNRKSWCVAIALGLLIPASTALAAGKGTTMFAFEAGQGNPMVSETVFATDTPSYIDAEQVPEINVQGEVWTFLADDFALTVSGGIGFGAYEAEPDDAADGTDKYTSSSFRLRLGGDRVGSVGERLTIFGGPGVEFVSAKLKYEESTTPAYEEESSSTTFIGVSGRIGMMMKMSESVSIVGRLGHALGRFSSSADRGNAKVKGWSNSFDAAWGLALSFGGN